ncbi:MAG: uroporphyrinogen-III synthase [Gammaproteobacteria bacterium]|nr:uroporphyrinogen-III synthase [Gammaproteobacteria bacterium]
MAGSDAMLAGITVWVTRPAHQAGDLCRMIEQRKGVPLPLPTLVIRPFTEARTEENRVLLAHADITVFISKNAVIHALDLFPDIADTVRGKTVLAVGQATARCLTASGFDMVGHAGAGGTEALLRLPQLNETSIKDKRIVIIRGQGGREELRDGLLAWGAVVDYLEVYQRDKPDMSEAEMTEFWQNQRPEAVIITSLAGLDNLVELTPAAESDRLLGTPMVVMSERIRQHAMESGFLRVAAASDNSDAGLVDALLDISGSMKK